MDENEKPPAERNTEDYTFKTPPNCQQQKSIQMDRAYEGIRGHEKHILFHFFGVFMFSFFIGVVLIHLSLWMNSHLLSMKQQCGIASLEQQEDHVNMGNSERNSETSNTDNSVSDVFDYIALQYTGVYFNHPFINSTNNALSR